MPDNATIYAPIHMLPDERHLAPLAPGAAINVRRDERRIVLAWPDLRVALTRMDDAAMGAHLMDLQGHVRRSGGGEALAIRVLSTLSVYGIVIEPGFDDEGRAMHLIAGICDATGGLWFREGQFLDGDGAPLLGPEARPLACPSRGRVAARALVLLAVAMRGLLDDDAGTPDELKADALRERLVDWLEGHHELAREIEPHEAGVLRAPIGTAPRQAIVNAVWGAEGAAVLLWALRARALPPHDVSEHPYEVADESGVLADERPGVLDATAMRPEEELWREQRRLLAIHWRMMEARLNHRAADFPALAQKEFLRGVDLAGIPVAEGDLAVDGLPVTKADAAALGRTGSIALERHRAANWLVGVHPVYSHVPTPT
jgi:hypothetical protein